MTRSEAASGENPLFWVGSAKDDLLDYEVRYGKN
jgi:hypothetical protein